MNQKYRKFWIRMVIIIVFPTNLIFSQSYKIDIDAGTSQFINWEETQTIQLEGTVSSKSIIVEWTCPANHQVHFHDALNPTTKAV